MSKTDFVSLVLCVLLFIQRCDCIKKGQGDQDSGMNKHHGLKVYNGQNNRGEDSGKAK